MVKGKILYLQYTNPTAYPPLENSSGILADEGWSVRFFGIQSHGSGNFKFAEHENIQVLLMNSARRGLRQKWHFIRYMLQSVHHARTWQPDWIYLSDMMTAPLGLLLKGMGYRVIYHEHDSPTPGAECPRLTRWILACRRRLAQRAAFNVLPQEERIRIFARETGTGRPVYCVWNCPRKAEVMAQRHSKVRETGESLKLYFHGSINLDRLPLSLIEGAKRSGVPVKLRVVGYETVGSQGASARLQHAAEKAGDLVELELLGSFDTHDEIIQQMDGMHVGWICFKNESGDINLQHLAGASNKAFDYLAAGLPLIVPRTSGWEEMFVAPGYAKSCDPSDDDSIAATLLWFFDHPEEAAAMGRSGQEWIREEWNYERQFAPIMERLQNDSQ